jgi:hypothetical protein
MSPAGSKNAPEAKAREKIDALLAQAGWLVQYREDMNLTASDGIAVREFKLEKGHGYVDYLLLVDGHALGVVEAKPAGYSLTSVEVQAKKYVEGLPKFVAGDDGGRQRRRLRGLIGTERPRYEERRGTVLHAEVPDRRAGGLRAPDAGGDHRRPGLWHGWVSPLGPHLCRHPLQARQGPKASPPLRRPAWDGNWSTASLASAQ